MEIIRQISDADLGLTVEDSGIFENRMAVRAVILNDKGEVGLLHSRSKNYLGMPGGGVKKEESFTDALKREVDEETGCKIKNIREIGIIEEIRSQTKTKQHSYCYLAELDGEVGTPHPEEDEIEEDFEISFCEIDMAIEKIKAEVPRRYSGNFAVRRNLIALEKVKEMLH